ncbi:glycoside hydrolase family 9 protein [Kribbella sp. NPDC050820]|uniref:glycoside hydrolase family 9 protein n=1 Tax=Kribbella sp. NPDC050820 TaxID=3155408 RepID=UPI0033FC32A2
MRVNQVGYLTSGPKRATYVTKATIALDWRLVDAGDRIVATGKTTPYGADAASGDEVQLIDFGRFRHTGSGFRLAVGDDVSEPFDIGDGIHTTLRRDALEYFYNNRSGIEIKAEYVGEQYSRAAGHIGIAPNKGDKSVPCFPGTCDYSLDVSGGWYDAGDHGKYVVNGALAAWQLLDLYEQSGTTALRIAEARNGIPDVLDEAAADPQQRYLYPPSTAATLNLAAVGSRCARIYARWDRQLAKRCLTAAEKAWNAARQHPALYAPPGGEGGGAYEDTKVADEFSWAAAELFGATGKASYKRFITTGLEAADGFSWQETGGLADLALAADLTGRTAYRSAALESLDYLLGRNPVGTSYVTGYGERSSHNQHHRSWAHSLNPALPSPYAGSLAGGPNSGLQDPVAQRNLQGCAPAKCYVDEIGSYSTNEVALNWNSALAWLTAYADTRVRNRPAGNRPAR